MIKSKLRGHPVKFDKDLGEWVYKDTGESIVEDRPCDKCGMMPTTEGHDACLGTLPGVRNACCGHGDKEYAYIQFEDGMTVRGDNAIETIKAIRKIGY